MSGKKEEKDRSGGIAMGLVLILIGALFLADRFNLMDLGDVWDYWPLLLIAYGVVKLVTGRNGEAVGSGITWTLFGLWFLAVQLDWYGLTYADSWPIALVAVGGGMVVRALIGDRTWGGTPGGGDGRGTF